MSAVKNILVLAAQLDLANFTDLILTDTVLRDYFVEVVIYFIVIVHQLISPRFQIGYDFALLNEALRNLLLVLSLLLNQLLIFYRDSLNFRLELRFLRQFLLERLAKAFNFLDIFDQLV